MPLKQSFNRKKIICNQYAKWQFLRRLKAIALLSLQKHNKWKQTKQLIPGIVTAISGWFHKSSRILIYDTRYIIYAPSRKSVSLKIWALLMPLEAYAMLLTACFCFGRYTKSCSLACKYLKLCMLPIQLAALHQCFLQPMWQGAWPKHILWNHQNCDRHIKPL